ncbi:hypothetical protein F511_22365 [Dorcoceras hygrometricum]|uniref:Uncharacterized protein n=1 Tax=Dorcoceras hygrometricum TaxID=472368 RepID=A0A2Z7C0W7_9LAMI|nr:hypothetical protein F511_22365 [Dorcoceras hygrometricum]
MVSKRRGRPGNKMTEESGAQNRVDHVIQPSISERRRASEDEPPPPPYRVAGIHSGQFDEENPSAHISSRLLVQGDEGVSYPVVDRIGVIYRNLPRRADVIVTTVGARNKCQQGSVFEHPIIEIKVLVSTTGPPPHVAALAAARFRAHVARHHAHRLRMVAEDLVLPRASRCAHHHRSQAAVTGNLLRDEARGNSSLGASCAADDVAPLRACWPAVALIVAPLEACWPDVVRRSLREEAAMCARWPHANAGRGANRCAAAAKVFRWWRPPVGRRSGESPAMS